MNNIIYLAISFLLTCISENTYAFASKFLLVQTVDLTTKNMSAEGGDAKLYHLKGRKGALCRIKVVHYGESGKATYDFTFGRALYSAEKMEYDYNSPISVNSNAKAVLRRTVTLTSQDGKKTLPAEFKTYKSFFDGGKLAQCSGKLSQLR